VGTRAACFSLLFALAYGGLAPRAHADHAEIERRLRAAALSRAERAAVHASIDRAVDYLAREQSPDGGFPTALGQGYVLAAPTRPSRVESTALSALALLHADTPRARGAADRALAYLIRKDGTPRHELNYRVVPASLTVLALAAAGRHAEVAHQLSRRIQGAQDKETGFWDHAMHNGARRRGNLPSSHFAILALHAGATQDASTWDWVWRNHLRALDGASRSRGFTYGPADKHRGTYPAAACMGLANQDLARRRLTQGQPQTVGPDPRAKRARAQLDKAIPSVLELLRGERVRNDWELRSQPHDAGSRTETLFDLFCLANAALFQGRETVGGERWYASGSELLLDRQNKDGGWGRLGRLATGRAARSSASETAFGVLFLTRAGSVYRPLNPRRIRVRDVDGSTSRGTPTPGPDSREPDEVTRDVTRETPAPLTPVMAWALLRELEQLIDDPSADDRLLRASIDDLQFAYATFDPASQSTPAAASDARSWRRGAELLLIRTVALDRTTPRRRVRGRPVRPTVRRPVSGAGPPVQTAAAEALGHTHRRVSAALRSVLSREYLGKDSRTVPKGLLTAAFESLSRLGDPDSAAWIVKHGVTDGTGTKYETCTRAALLALGRLQDVSGELRLLLCWKILRRFSKALPQPQVRRSTSARLYGDDWPVVLRPAALRALRHLCRAPHSGQIPGLDRWTTSLSDIEKWLHFHEDPSDLPWTAPKGR